MPKLTEAPHVEYGAPSFFQFEDAAFGNQQDSLAQVAQGIRSTTSGKTVKKAYSKRYAPGLRLIKKEKLRALDEFLLKYLED